MAVLELFLLPPVFRAFGATLAAGIVFPLAGLAIIELRLLPLRFMLMHGAILGGVVALLAAVSPIAGAIVTNVILLFFMGSLGRLTANRFDLTAMFLMVVTLAGAVTLLSLFDVPAQVAVSLLWGNPFAVTTGELTILWVFVLLVLFSTFRYRNQIVAFLFDREVAFTLGVPVNRVEYLFVLGVAIAVSLGVRILGALLLDGLVLLPGLTAVAFGRSARGTILAASLIGAGTAVVGFFFALAVDLPVSSGIVFASLVALGGGYALRKWVG